MNPSDNIEKNIKKALLHTAPQTDDHILTAATEALKNAPAYPLAQHRLTWNNAINSRIAQISAAAAIIVATLIFINRLGPSIDPTTIALAHVQKAFLARPWVHIKYDNGTEDWRDLATGKRYFKDWDGRCLFIDNALNIRQNYFPLHGQHITEDRPTIYKDNKIPPYSPKTAWDAIVGHLERIVNNPIAGRFEAERHTELIAGKQMLRFDSYYYDALEQRLLLQRIWADPETRLPVKIWKRLQLADREDQNRESIIGVIDFPENGPSSIYDLGVPHDLPVVKQYDYPDKPLIAEIINTAKNAYNNFPKCYRAIIWENDRESEIDTIYRDGEKIRSNRYFNIVGADYSEYHLDLPATADRVLEWTQTQPPVSIYIFDGKKMYHRRGHHPAIPDRRKARARVTRWDSMPSSSKPIENQWPYMNRTPGRFIQINEVPEELSNHIALRIETGDIRRDFYIDPTHDYICTRWIWWKLRKHRWEKEREYFYDEFAQLPQGQWYVTRRILITYADPERGTGQGGYNRNIDIKLLGKDDYPPNTFDGKKLLEGAEVETY